MTALITIRDLSMVFDGTEALKKISFEIGEGEIVGIIGRSGAGKTVLMHLLRGVDQPPTSGQVIYHVARCAGCGQRRVAEPGGAALSGLRRHLRPHRRRPLGARRTRRSSGRSWPGPRSCSSGPLPSTATTASSRTCFTPSTTSTIPSEKAIGRAADLLDEVRLSHRMMHIARDLSGGEKQRVVLARQLAKEPFLLFADEPTGTLDPETAAIVHGVLKTSVKDQGMGMVVTSHFSNVIESLADRALLLENGEIIAIGAPAEVVARFMQDYADLEAFEKPDLGENLLVARDVMKRYISVDRGVVRAVNGVGFDVKRGEIFGIIGRSGAGKTTLSRIIAGIIEPTGGEMNIRVGDEWVDMTKPGIEFRGRAKGYIGLLHQEYDLFPHRTVLDNLTDAIGLEFPKELAMRKAIVTLRMAGFSDEKSRAVLDRLPGQLSEGEKHRVALAQVLIREPMLVILDEPTGTMDPITKIDVKHSILHAREEMEETFIVVSHDMDFVRDICDRLALMRGGKIIKIGPTAEVLEHLTEEERRVMTTGSPA